MPQLALMKPKELFEYFESSSFQKKLIAAIPNQLRPERMIQLALSMIKGSPALMGCTPISLLASVFECAQLGLELDKVLGHAYLVPYKSQCQLIIGYRGFCHLMYQSGVVMSVTAEVVRAKDKFRRTLGTERKLIHDPAPIPKEDDYDTWRGAYAVVKFLTGHREFEYLEASQIEGIRARSQSWRKFKDEGKQSPWDTDAEEMWRKTPTRRLAKRMPISTTDKRDTLLRAVMLDEYGEKPGLLKPTEEGFVVADDYAAAEPELAPTTEIEDQLRESIEVVNAKKQKPGREKKKPPKEPPKGKYVVSEVDDKKKTITISAVKPSAPPKAEIPKADPPLTDKQQTAIFQNALQAGWKIDEVIAMLDKKFKVKSVKFLLASQYDAVMRVIESGT